MPQRCQCVKISSVPRQRQGLCDGEDATQQALYTRSTRMMGNWGRGCGHDVMFLGVVQRDGIPQGPLFAFHSGWQTTTITMVGLVWCRYSADADGEVGDGAFPLSGRPGGESLGAAAVWLVAAAGSESGPAMGSDSGGPGKHQRSWGHGRQQLAAQASAGMPTALTAVSTPPLASLLTERLAVSEGRPIRAAASSRTIRGPAKYVPAAAWRLAVRRAVGDVSAIGDELGRGLFFRVGLLDSAAAAALDPSARPSVCPSVQQHHHRRQHRHPPSAIHHPPSTTHQPAPPATPTNPHASPSQSGLARAAAVLCRLYPSAAES